MNLLYQDQHFLAIDKPAGFFVHPPERSPYPVPATRICLHLLRQSLRQEVFPAHRLDAPTSGLVLFAKSREAAGELGRLFRERQVSKTYRAVARGWLEDEGLISKPLSLPDRTETIEAETRFRTLARHEFPVAVGTRYPTARYSLVEVQPLTGRWHQIRRHFDQIAHPLLGDIEHGDSHHNRFFRDQLGLRGLCLRAQSLAFTPPWSADMLKLEAPLVDPWQRIYEVFSFAPGPDSI